MKILITSQSATTKNMKKEARGIFDQIIENWALVSHFIFVLLCKIHEIGA